MHGHTRRGEARDQYLDLAVASVGIHGRCGLFECIFGFSTVGINTLSLTFEYATNLGHGAHPLSRLLLAQTRLPTVFYSK